MTYVLLLYQIYDRRYSYDDLLESLDNATANYINIFNDTTLYGDLSSLSGSAIGVAIR